MDRGRVVPRRAASHAELGCGRANLLIGTLLSFPELTGVGVGVCGPVLEEARASARAARVDDRLELRRLDARDLTDVEAFDTLYWSHSFFPLESRAATLQAAFRCLVPGGYLYTAPVVNAPPEDGSPGPTGQAFSVNQLIYANWGVPLYTEAELRGELEDAGFTFVPQKSCWSALPSCCCSANRGRRMWGGHVPGLLEG